MSSDTGQAAAAWVTIVVTLGIAIVGWAQAIRSERRAKSADTHADEALELARSAEARADRLERTALEKRDVTWVQRQVGPNHLGTLSFQNVGSDPAREVELIVDPLGDDHPRQIETFASVPAGDRIGINLTTLANEAARRVVDAPPGVIMTSHFSVRARVTWRSESGVPSIQEWDSVTI